MIVAGVSVGQRSLVRPLSVGVDHRQTFPLESRRKSPFIRVVEARLRLFKALYAHLNFARNALVARSL